MRSGAVAGASVALLWGASVAAPAALLVWMPIVLGVPHVASDLRYMLAPLPRGQRIASIAACSLLVALRAIALATGARLIPVEVAVVSAWLVGIIALGPTTLTRFAIALAAAVAIVFVPIGFATAATFAHNAIAVVAWLVVARPERRRAVRTVAWFAIAVALAMVLGPAIAGATGGDATRWMSLDSAARALFPGVPGGRALVVGFALMQALHYAVWLVWIPRAGPRGRLPLAVLAAALVVIAAGLVDATWARATYLALATFHIYLELVVLAATWARRR
jgi:hypothetical protein